MLTYFTCPDKVDIQIEDCLPLCRLGSRCLTKPTLNILAQRRPWNGVPSTTQLLNGTIMEYLKITKPYAITPTEQAFLLLGINHHSQLDKSAKELGIPSEIALDGGRNIIDLLVNEGDGWQLIDNKCWGSYRVAKALGIVKEGKGKDAHFNIDHNSIDLFEPEMQLNNYRLILEARANFKIEHMGLQVIVRDGDTFMAESRGIFKKFYNIPIRPVDEDFVKIYFLSKESQLLFALKETIVPPLCSEYECWEGARCRKYCEVAQWCPRGQQELLNKERRDAST